MNQKSIITDGPLCPEHVDFLQRLNCVKVENAEALRGFHEPVDPRLWNAVRMAIVLLTFSDPQRALRFNDGRCEIKSIRHAQHLIQTGVAANVTIDWSFTLATKSGAKITFELNPPDALRDKVNALRDMLAGSIAKRNSQLRQEWETPHFATFRHARCHDPLGQAVTELFYQQPKQTMNLHIPPMPKGVTCTLDTGDTYGALVPFSMLLDSPASSSLNNAMRLLGADALAPRLYRSRVKLSPPCMVNDALTLTTVVCQVKDVTLQLQTCLSSKWTDGYPDNLPTLGESAVKEAQVRAAEDFLTEQRRAERRAHLEAALRFNPTSAKCVPTIWSAPDKPKLEEATDTIIGVATGDIRAGQIVSIKFDKVGALVSPAAKGDPSILDNLKAAGEMPRCAAGRVALTLSRQYAAGSSLAGGLLGAPKAFVRELAAGKVHADSYSKAVNEAEGKPSEKEAEPSAQVNALFNAVKATMEGHNVAGFKVFRSVEDAKQLGYFKGQMLRMSLPSPPKLEALVAALHSINGVTDVIVNLDQEAEAFYLIVKRGDTTLYVGVPGEQLFEDEPEGRNPSLADQVRERLQALGYRNVTVYDNEHRYQVNVSPDTLVPLVLMNIMRDALPTQMHAVSSLVLSSDDEPVVSVKQGKEVVFVKLNKQPL